MDELTNIFDQWVLQKPIEELFMEMKIADLPATVAQRQTWFQNTNLYCHKLCCYQFAEKNQLWCKKCAVESVYCIK